MTYYPFGITRQYRVSMDNRRRYEERAAATAARESQSCDADAKKTL